MTIPKVHKTGVWTEAPSILVLDDEPLVGKSVGRVLQTCNVVITETVHHALTLLGERHFDLVLCDLLMPIHNGRDFYEAVRRHHPGQEKRIIFMSGGVYGDVLRAFWEGVPNRKICKPFDIALLRSVISEELQAQQTVH